MFMLHTHRRYVNLSWGATGSVPRKRYVTRFDRLARMYLSRYTFCRKNLMLYRPQPQKTPLFFFRTAAGSEPVREWLKGLPAAERQAIGKDLLRAQ